MTTKKINYPNCDKQGHSSEPLSRICVDKNCDNNTVVCCLCEELEHKSHQTVPLKTFLQKIGSNLDSFNLVNPFYYTNRVQQLRTQFFCSISSQRKRIMQIFNDLQLQGQAYFNNIYQMTASLISIGNVGSALNQFSQNPKSLKSYFSKLMKFVDLQSRSAFSLKKQLQIIIDSCRDKDKKLQASFQEIKSCIDKSLQKVVSSLNDNAVFKSPVFHWSQQLKGHKVKITATIAQQTNMESSGQRFALIEPSLSQFGKRKQFWGIKLKKFVGWIGLGVCLRNSIEKANYHFNYTNIGHGSYLISSNGYSWSHSVKQFNSAFKTFQFTVNDTVYVEYDPENWKLRFRKNQGPENFELSILPPPSDDSYHPCVNLCSTGDSVQVILPGFPLS